MLTDVYSSFTDRLSGKFATNATFTVLFFDARCTLVVYA